MILYTGVNKSTQRLYSQNRTLGAYDNLSGTGMLMEMAIAVKKYQQQIPEAVCHISVIIL